VIVRKTNPSFPPFVLGYLREQEPGDSASTEKALSPIVHIVPSPSIISGLVMLNLAGTGKTDSQSTFS